MQFGRSVDNAPLSVQDIDVGSEVLYPVSQAKEHVELYSTVDPDAQSLVIGITCDGKASGMEQFTTMKPERQIEGIPCESKKVYT